MQITGRLYEVKQFTCAFPKKLRLQSKTIRYTDRDVGLKKIIEHRDSLISVKEYTQNSYIKSVSGGFTITFPPEAIKLAGGSLMPRFKTFSLIKHGPNAFKLAQQYRDNWFETIGFDRVSSMFIYEEKFFILRGNGQYAKSKKWFYTDNRDEVLQQAIAYMNSQLEA